MASELVQVRVSGILIEDGKTLLVKQAVSAERTWSLPGGRLKSGETLEQAMTREMEEETGLRIRIARLLYVCDKTDVAPSLVHMTFLLERVGGTLRLPTNELDRNPIHDVRMVPITELSDYGFSREFMGRVTEDFPDAGSYKGDKRNIGL